MTAGDQSLARWLGSARATASLVVLLAAVACLVVAARASAAGPVSLYVSASGTGTACAEAAPCGSVDAAVAVAAGSGYAGDAVTIDVGAGAFAESGGVVIGAGSESSLSIAGAGAGSTTIEPSGAASVVTITVAFPVTLQALTVTGGQAPVGGSGGGVDDTGGQLTITDCVISGNRAGAGSPVANAGNGSDGSGNEIFAGNGGNGVTGSSGGDGGGIYDTGSGLTITDSTISGNTAGTGGYGGNGGSGGNGGEAPGSAGNAANGGNGGDGGGVGDSAGDAAITDSTISGNTAGTGGYAGNGGAGGNTFGAPGGNGGNGGNGGTGGNGGGVQDAADGLAISASTISANTNGVAGPFGGNGGLGGTGLSRGTIGATGIGGVGGGVGGGVADTAAWSLGASALDNRDGNCAAAASADGGYNVASDSSCFAGGAGDSAGLTATDLGPLAFNGGPTQTIALLGSSGSDPAIAAVATGCSSTDQRGVPRPRSGCDAGAYEATQSFAGQLIVSELRLGGPGGMHDQYVELFNASGAPLSVADWQLKYERGVGTTGTVPLPDDVIPTNGHLLLAGSGYSEGSVAAGDVALPLVAPHGGVAVIAPDGTSVDAVGFADASGGLYAGTPIPLPASVASGDYAWARNFADGAPVDTGDNAADFAYVATGGDSGPAGSPVLGAPGPEDLASPVVHNDILQSSLLDPGAAQNASPNTVYTPGSNGSPGTLIINRVLTNCSAQPQSGACVNGPGAGSVPQTATRLRFRVTGLTTIDSPGAGPAQAVLEAETSSGDGPYPLSAGGSASGLGLALDAPSTTGMGGLNSTLTATGDLPGAPSAPGLAPGASIDVEFAFSVAQTGAFSFAYNAEDDLVSYAAPIEAPTTPGTPSVPITAPTTPGTPVITTPTVPPAVASAPVAPAVAGAITSTGVTITAAGGPSGAHLATAKKATAKKVAKKVAKKKKASKQKKGAKKKTAAKRRKVPKLRATDRRRAARTASNHRSGGSQ